MPPESRSPTKWVGLGCGGAFLGAFLVGNLVEYLGHNELGADDRAGIASAYYLGAPLGAYIGIRIVPAVWAGWKKFRASRRNPPAP